MIYLPKKLFDNKFANIYKNSYFNRVKTTFHIFYIYAFKFLL